MNVPLQQETPPLLTLNQSMLEQIDYSLAEVLDVVEKAIIGLRRPDSVNPPKIVIERGDKQSIAYSMAGRDGTHQTVGFKVAYRFDPSRTQGAYQHYAFVFLCDDATGAPIALMNVALIGPLRTAATSALLARQCATRDARVALIVGSGVQARMAVPMLATAMPHLERLIVHGHHAEGLREVDASLARHHPQRNIEISTSLQASAASADVVIGVAGSGAREAVHHGWLKSGAVAVLVGYGIDADALHHANYVVATDAIQMRITGSDLADSDGQLPAVNAELPDLLLGQHPARHSPNDIVFAYNSGLVVTDIAVGRMLAERARQQGLGFEVPLW